MKSHPYIVSFYIITLIILSVFTWGFVDANFFRTIPTLYALVYSNRGASTAIYISAILSLFICYYLFLQLAHENRITVKQARNIIALTVIVLFFSFPAFSNDIYNYIATAKVTFVYKENPYIVMPIELSNEPMLKYMHASNKVALYGPAWIMMTSIPFILGMNNVFVSIFTFKLFILFFYVGLSWLIWKLSKKQIHALIFFSLNPLVIAETMISIHNDVVMMFLALYSMHMLMNKRIIVSVILLIGSILIKGATVMLIPIYCYVLYLIFMRKHIIWSRIWLWSAILMYTIFFLSPFREELYPWYFVWPLTFVSLLPGKSLLKLISLGFSFGLLFRIAPFIYYREWGGITPLIKKTVSILPPIVSVLIYEIRKNR